MLKISKYIVDKRAQLEQIDGKDLQALDAKYLKIAMSESKEDVEKIDNNLWLQIDN